MGISYAQSSFYFLNLMTIHKSFLTPIKGRAQCYVSLHSNLPEHLWGHDAGKMCHREGYIYYTNYQYIMNTCVCGECPHCLAWFDCFPNVIKALLHGFDLDI